MSKKEQTKNEKLMADMKDVAKDKVTEVVNQVSSKAKELKNKFEKADPDTKKKIVAGLAAVAATLVALSKMKKKPTEKNQ